jgi:hypothetical protein
LSDLIAVSLMLFLLLFVIYFGFQMVRATITRLRVLEEHRYKAARLMLGKLIERSDKMQAQLEQIKKRLEEHNEPDIAAKLPELTDEERAAMKALGGDFIQRLLAGERPLGPPPCPKCKGRGAVIANCGDWLIGCDLCHESGASADQSDMAPQKAKEKK